MACDFGGGKASSIMANYNNSNGIKNNNGQISKNFGGTDDSIHQLFSSAIVEKLMGMPKYYIYANLEGVMNCMETGKTVVLHNLDEIYEPSYDMLNRRQIVTRAGKMYCRVALNAESRTCFIW